MLQPAPVQTVYTRYMTPGQNGMLADETNFVSDTKIVETAAGIGFGLGVSQGTNDRGCIIGGAAFVGVTWADKTLLRTDVITDPIDTYLQYDNAGVLSAGDIWVNVYASVTPATTVTFSATTGQIGLAGTTITHARYMTSAAGSAGTPVLAVLRLGDPSSR
jgi:hypothetical protein